MTQQAPATQAIITGRLSYAKLFKPENFKGVGEPKYSTVILIPKTSEQGKADFARLQSASTAAKLEKYGDPEKFPHLTPDRVCVKDGDTLGKEETKGMWVVNASDAEAPVLLDSDGVTELTSVDGKLYSGGYARVVINFWMQDHQSYGKRINANLLIVQFVAHGEAFGSGRSESLSQARAAIGSLTDTDVAGLGFGDAAVGDQGGAPAQGAAESLV